MINILILLGPKTTVPPTGEVSFERPDHSLPQASASTGFCSACPARASALLADMQCQYPLAGQVCRSVHHRRCVISELKSSSDHSSHFIRRLSRDFVVGGLDPGLRRGLQNPGNPPDTSNTRYDEAEAFKSAKAYRDISFLVPSLCDEISHGRISKTTDLHQDHLRRQLRRILTAMGLTGGSLGV